MFFKYLSIEDQSSLSSSLGIIFDIAIDLISLNAPSKAAHTVPE